MKDRPTELSCITRNDVMQCKSSFPEISMNSI